MQKTLVITGATSGIGKALVEYFLKRGEHVVALGRSESRLEALKQEYNALDGTLSTYCADFLSLEAIKETSAHIIRDFSSGIDVLINNAAMVPKKKVLTDDGFERQFQVNHLAVVYLTYLLFDLLKKREGTVITTSSDAHKKAKFNAHDIQALSRYHTLRSYMRTKLYNLLFTFKLNDNILRKHNMRAYAVHPGLIKTEIGTKDTSKIYAWLWRLFTRRGHDVTMPVLTYAFLVYEQDKKSSILYFYNGQPHTYSDEAKSTENQTLLWEETMKMLNIKTWQ